MRSAANRRAAIELRKLYTSTGSLVPNSILTGCSPLQGLNPSTKRLEITTTANQDPVLTHVPIIGVDIWEHAFYLQYLNVKADYLNAIWNVINFDEAEKRYLEAIGGSKL